MKAGPVRRVAGALGLLALLPTALMLLGGQITLEVAAIRAAITLVSACVVARVGGWGVGLLADSAQARVQPDEATEQEAAVITGASRPGSPARTTSAASRPGAAGSPGAPGTSAVGAGVR
jgi:hypothetical protein